jgi:DNA modification methylase
MPFGYTASDLQTFSLDSIEFDLDKIRDKNYLTHNFHPYPAKFIPQFPRKLIEILSQSGEIVLDPFCGCGTTMVEAKLLGRNSIGVDINPIATLVSRVKTTVLTAAQLEMAKKIVSECSRTVAASQGMQLLGEQTTFG